MTISEQIAKGKEKANALASLSSLSHNRHMLTPEQSELADKICEAIATQSKSLGAILADLGKPISCVSWYAWLQKDESLLNRYMRARADQAQVMADEIVQIADTQEIGEIRTLKGDGTEEVKIADMIEHRRLRIESRKWVAAKLLPKVYGDRTEVTGAGGGPLQTVIQIVSAVPRPERVALNGQDVTSQLTIDANVTDITDCEESTG